MPVLAGDGPGGWSDGTSIAADVALLSRFFERFAGQAVEIAHSVIYRSTNIRANVAQAAALVEAPLARAQPG